METLELTLIISALLCSMVGGFLFAYAVVIMPGIAALGDREFLRAFQVTDRVIQRNHPLFMLVWVGSVVALLAGTVLGFGQLEGVDRALLLVASAVYLFGVQGSTAAIHLPLNNRLQALDLDNLGDSELASARRDFEPRWNASNRIRTALACGVGVVLIVLVARS